ncbi:MAG: hypothetical protein WCX93_11395, partial [Burkholderiaceae bacterium]
NRPLLLALILSLPLWVILGNFIVALIAALLLSFLLSMYNALRILNRKKHERTTEASKDTE